MTQQAKWSIPRVLGEALIAHDDPPKVLHPSNETHWELKKGPMRALARR
jgi:hypothetical protein